MKTLITSLFLFAAAMVPSLAEDAVTLEVTGNDQMQYDKKELTVTEGQKVTIKFKHIGKLPKAAMGHNVVILKPGTAMPAFAMKCAPAAANDYIPEDAESKALIVAHTKMIGGGEETSVTFTAPAAGEYPYLCTFPGHFGIMNGKMIVKAK
ncbi:azurin [Haloferula rosea]|uniref:Azurin n=1 Tax=Haloferula rosea TaxID=490093 RepID=A0A934RE37_9BACT|nr:azurin [Haloferula rosea]MBK1827983.1 azurin [Haloferula rosea]